MTLDVDFAPVRVVPDDAVEITLQLQQAGGPWPAVDADHGPMDGGSVAFIPVGSDLAQRPGARFPLFGLDDGRVTVWLSPGPYDVTLERFGDGTRAPRFFATARLDVCEGGTVALDVPAVERDVVVFLDGEPIDAGSDPHVGLTGTSPTGGTLTRTGRQWLVPGAYEVTARVDSPVVLGSFEVDALVAGAAGSDVVRIDLRSVPTTIRFAWPAAPAVDGDGMPIRIWAGDDSSTVWLPFETRAGLSAARTFFAAPGSYDVLPQLLFDVRPSCCGFQHLTRHLVVGDGDGEVAFENDVGVVTLGGRVILDGEPAANDGSAAADDYALVFTRRRSGDDARYGLPLRLDGDGRFEANFLSDSTHYVYLRRGLVDYPVGEVNIGAGGDRDFAISLVDLTIDLRVDGAAPATVDGDRGWIRIDVEGRPERSTWVPVPERGAASSVPRPAGSYRVYYHHDAAGIPEMPLGDVELSAGAPRRIEADVRTAQIGGAVLRAGEPVVRERIPSLWIRRRGANGRELRAVRIAPEGGTREGLRWQQRLGASDVFTLESPCVDTCGGGELRAGPFVLYPAP